MIKFIKIELYKILKMRQFVGMIVTLIIFLLLSCFVSVYTPSQRDNLLMYFYNIFTVNNSILFPVSVAVFFGPILVNEYEKNTIKLMFSSKFSKHSMYIGKFLACASVFTVCFTVIIICYLAFIIFFITKDKNILAGYWSISLYTAIGRMLFILIIEISYLICFGSFIFMICTITKRQSITFLLGISVIILFSFIPIPQKIMDFIFLRGNNIQTSITTFRLPIIRLFKILFVNISTTILFLGIGSFLFGKHEI